MIDFDKETHTYTVDGVVYPSVTQVIGEAGMYGSAAAYWDDHSRDRGSNVHKAIELYHRGTLDMNALDPVIMPYMKAWLSFLDVSNFYPSMIEHRLYNTGVMVAGTADMIGPVKDGAAIIDIKTGAPGPAAAIQLAGYEFLYGAAQRIVVQLKKDGKFKCHYYTDRHDRDVFLSAVSVYHWRKANVKGG